ncbi:hypothetical protein LJR231_001526 [Phyllobacterium sp. LjRoot231]|uniref:hypothetical protein n=1 Tax=Phyllobacterium sp. LjRoot231 TaxID=3342289 RepID=UPI003ECCC7B4
MSISPKALQALKYIFDAGGKATERSMIEDMGPLGKSLPRELFPKYVGVNGHSDTLYLTSEGRAELDIHPKTPKRTAEDHMIWCKERALDYVKRGALIGATTSMSSDLRKHPETAEQPRGLMIMGMTVSSYGAEAVRRWIEGFEVGKPHVDLDKVDAAVNREFSGRTPARAPSRFEGNIAAMPVGQDATPYTRGAELNLMVRDLTNHGSWELAYRIPHFERFDARQVADAGAEYHPILNPNGSRILKRRNERRAEIMRAAERLANAIIQKIEAEEGWDTEEMRERETARVQKIIHNPPRKDTGI